MELGVVIGQVVSTAKCKEMDGDRLLVVHLVDPTKKKGARVASNAVCHVAVDAVGAGVGEWVLLTRGSSARLASKTGATKSVTQNAMNKNMKRSSWL